MKYSVMCPKCDLTLQVEDKEREAPCPTCKGARVTLFKVGDAVKVKERALPKQQVATARSFDVDYITEGTVISTNNMHVTIRGLVINLQDEQTGSYLHSELEYK
jgi:Zn-finger nucleic acid-binding protein